MILQERQGKVINETQFQILRKCQGKFDCLVYEMLSIKERNPSWNTQADSILAKLFVWLEHSNTSIVLTSYLYIFIKYHFDLIMMWAQCRNVDVYNKLLLICL